MRDDNHAEPLATPPPPPPPPAPPGLNNATRHILPQPEIPQPRNPTKRLAWDKIPVTTVVGRNNVWAELSRAADVEFCQPNYGRIEKLFTQCRPTSAASDCSTTDDVTASPVMAADDHLNRKKTVVNLIDNKRSMNVNIFLRQFSGLSYVDVVSCLRTANVDGLFDPDRLRSLLQIIPDSDDIDRLNQYQGPRDCLGQAERFYLELMTIPNYELLIEALLIKLEFQETLERIKVSLDAIVVSAQEIKQNKAIRQLIYTVLLTGNFLNTGHYGGNAAGFRLDSLLKLKDLKSNTPGINLIHVVAQEALDQNPGLVVQLQNVLRDLHDAAGYPLDTLTSDIKLLRAGITSVLEHINGTESEICQDMTPFFESADDDLKLLSDEMVRVEAIRVQLAEYFCEDVKTFKLDDCIGTFNEFCQQFLRAVEENKERAAQQLKAEQRRLQRESKSRDPCGEHDVVDAGVLTKSVPPSSRDVISAGSSGDDLEQCLLRRATDSRWSGRQSRSRSSGRFSSNLSADAQATISRERPPSSSNKLNGEDSVTPSGPATSADIERSGKGEPAAVTSSSFSRFDAGRSSCPSQVLNSYRTQRYSSSSAAETESASSNGNLQSTAPAADENLLKAVSGRPVRVDPAANSRSGNKMALRKKDSLGLERTSNLTVKATTELSNSSIDLLTPCLSLLNSSSQLGSAEAANDTERALRSDGKVADDAPSVAKCKDSSMHGSSQYRHQPHSTTKNDAFDRQRDVTKPEPVSSSNARNVSTSSMSNGESSCGKMDVGSDGIDSPSVSSIDRDTPRRRSLKEKFKRLSELYSDSDGETDIISGYNKTMRLSHLTQTEIHAETVPSVPAARSTANDCQRPEEHVTVPADPACADMDSTSASAGPEMRKSSVFSVVSDEGFDSDPPRQDGGRSQQHPDRMSISSSSSGFSTNSSESGSAFATGARLPPRSAVANNRGVSGRTTSQTASTGAAAKASNGKEAAAKKTPAAIRVTGTQPARPTVENLSRRLNNFMLATASSTRRGVNQPPRSNTSVVTKSTVQRSVRDSGSTASTTARKIPPKPATPATVRAVSTNGPSAAKSQSPVSTAPRQTSAALLSGKTNSNTRVDQKPEAIERPRKPRPPTSSASSSPATPFVRGAASRSSGGSDGMMGSALTPFVRNTVSRSSTPASLFSRGHELSVATVRSKGNVETTGSNNIGTTGDNSGRLASRPSRRDTSVGRGRLEAAAAETSRPSVGSSARTRSTGSRTSSRVSDPSPLGARVLASTSTASGTRNTAKVGPPVSQSPQQRALNETPSSSCGGQQQQEQVLYRTWIDTSDVYYV